MAYDKSTIERLCGVGVAVSEKQLNAISEWKNSYEAKSGGKLRLASAISCEIARLVTLEMKSEVFGSERAEVINKIYQSFLKNLRQETEYAAAFGGVVFKPYYSDGQIHIDCTNATEFYPIEFDSNGRICGAVFRSELTLEKRYYTKLEVHKFSNNTEYIKNMVFESSTVGVIGKRVRASRVPQWAELPEDIAITNIERPLFTYFKMPFANAVDINSPLGVSVFSKALGLIRDAEEQYERLLWEFESSERALYISTEALRVGEDGNPILPKGDKRLYRTLQSDSADFYKDFSPAIRNANMSEGLDEILRKIEFECSLAYGTISNVQNVDKTAEEIKSSKQRSYAAVSDIQSALNECLKDLVYIIDVWVSLAKLAPEGEYNMSTEWNDSILADRQKEFEEKRALVADGLMQPWEFRMWYFGEDEESAKRMTATDELVEE